MTRCPVCQGQGRARRLALVLPDGRQPDLRSCEACDGTGQLEYVLLSGGRKGPRKARVLLRDGSEHEVSVPRRLATVRIVVSVDGRTVLCKLLQVDHNEVMVYQEVERLPMN